MERAHGGPIEPQQAASLEDAIEDGLGEIVVVEYAAPRLQRLVGVTIIGRCRRCPSLTTWKSILAASVPYVR